MVLFHRFYMSTLFDKQFLFVTGKGGVGKTTASAALALQAARRGKRVLLAMSQAKERLSAMLEIAPIGPTHVRIEKGLDVVNTNPVQALQEYGEIVLKSKRVAKAVLGNPYIHSFLHGTPGMDAWATLGKAYFHATYQGPRTELKYDLVIADGPATGHALDMLKVPKVICEIAPPGLLRREAEGALRLFQDKNRCALVLVTLLEDLPIKETFELKETVENELHFHIGAMVVNQYIPPIFTPEERKEWLEKLASFSSKTPSSQESQNAFYRTCRIQMMKEKAQHHYLQTLRNQYQGDLFFFPLVPKIEIRKPEIKSFAEVFAQG